MKGTMDPRGQLWQSNRVKLKSIESTEREIAMLQDASNKLAR